MCWRHLILVPSHPWDIPGQNDETSPDNLRVSGSAFQAMSCEVLIETGFQSQISLENPVFSIHSSLTG